MMSDEEIEKLIASAMLFDEIGSFEEAETAYRTVLGKDPNHLVALINLGSVLNAMKKSQEMVQIMAINSVITITLAFLYIYHLPNN